MTNEPLTNRHPLLDAVVRHRRPLVPVPTDVVPRSTTFSDVRAVIFDVYGTLIISGCGEVGVAMGDVAAGGVSAGNVDGTEGGSQIDPREVAMTDAFRAVGWDAPTAGLPTPAMLDNQIRALNEAAARAPGTKPEVDLFKAWRRTSAAAVRDDLDRYLRREPVRARRVRGVEKAWRWCRRREFH